MNGILNYLKNTTKWPQKMYPIKSFNFAKSNFKSYIMNIIHSMHGCFSIIILDLKKKVFGCHVFVMPR